MENDFGTLTDLDIRFQEAVLVACQDWDVDANNLTESDWNNLYRQLTEESFGDLVITAIDVASGNWDIRVAFADYDNF